MSQNRSHAWLVLRWLGLLVVLVVGAIGLHTLLPLADGPVAVGVVAALLWIGIYAWETHVA